MNLSWESLGQLSRERRQNSGSKPHGSLWYELEFKRVFGQSQHCLLPHESHSLSDKSHCHIHANFRQKIYLSKWLPIFDFRDDFKKSWCLKTSHPWTTNFPKKPKEINRRHVMLVRTASAVHHCEHNLISRPVGGHSLSVMNKSFSEKRKRK